MPDRLFVAIWPDDAARAALAETVESARHTAPFVRWQAPERWHITLAFLGATEPDRASTRITTHLTGANVGAAERIHLMGAGTFGPVLWVGVDHGAWLTGLAAALQRALHVQDRRFRAHVTVGRVRGGDAPALAREALPLLIDHHGPAWIPESISLVESRTGPSPAYRIVKTWPLGPQHN